MRKLLLSSLLAVATLACGGESGTTDTTSSGAGGAGGEPPITCDSPDATPETACGTLSFAKSDVLSRKRNHHASFLAKTGAGSFIYVIGGTNGAFPIANVDRYPVNADGSLGAANDEVAIPKKLGGLTGGVVSNAIVIAGGTTASTVNDQAYVSVIGDDGSLGPWNPAGSVLHPRMHPGAVVDGDAIYVMGGFQDPTVWDDVVRATVSADGTLSSWTPAGTLPGPLSHFAVTKVGEYVYLMGGLEKSALQNPPTLKRTWRGHLAADGTIGEWQAMPDLPVPLATHASLYWGGYIYTGGGIDPTKQEDRLWRAPILADHTLGPWEETAKLLIARGHVHQFPMFENHVYSIAGAIDFNLNSTDEIDIGTFE
jgi:hypothetical protein